METTNVEEQVVAHCTSCSTIYTDLASIRMVKRFKEEHKDEDLPCPMLFCRGVMRIKEV